MALRDAHTPTDRDGAFPDHTVEHDSYCAGCGEFVDEEKEDCVWENVEHNIIWHDRKHCIHEVMQKYLGCQEV